MDKKVLFGVLIIAAGTLVSQEVLLSSRIDIILNSLHGADHLPEDPRYNNTTRTSEAHTSISTVSTTTTTV
jgi:hypothetical protein